MDMMLQAARDWAAQASTASPLVILLSWLVLQLTLAIVAFLVTPDLTWTGSVKSGAREVGPPRSVGPSSRAVADKVASTAGEERLIGTGTFAPAEVIALKALRRRVLAGEVSEGPT